MCSYCSIWTHMMIAEVINMSVHFVVFGTDICIWNIPFQPCEAYINENITDLSTKFTWFTFSYIRLLIQRTLKLKKLGRWQFSLNVQYQVIKMRLNKFYLSIDGSRICSQRSEVDANPKNIPNFLENLYESRERFLGGKAQTNLKNISKYAVSVTP